MNDYDTMSDYESMNDYGTSINVAKFVSLVGWVGVAAGVGVSLWLVSAGDLALLGIPSAITVALVGLLLVISGQASRAVLDTANSSREMLEIMRKRA